MQSSAKKQPSQAGVSSSTLCEHTQLNSKSKQASEHSPSPPPPPGCYRHAAAAANAKDRLSSPTLTRLAPHSPLGRPLAAGHELLPCFSAPRLQHNHPPCSVLPTQRRRSNSVSPHPRQQPVSHPGSASLFRLHDTYRSKKVFLHQTYQRAAPTNCLPSTSRDYSVSRRGCEKGCGGENEVPAFLLPPPHSMSGCSFFPAQPGRPYLRSARLHGAGAGAGAAFLPSSQAPCWARNPRSCCCCCC